MVVWLLLLDHVWPVFSALVIAFTVYVLVRAITGTWKVGPPPLKPKGFVGPKVEVYVGERNAEGKRHGKGTLTYPNGSVYEGDFVDGKPWGRGKATSRNGDTYIGGWVDGKRHNAGEVHYADGSCFVGTFDKGKKQGRGVLTLKNLHSVEGNYRDGVMVEAIIRSRDHIYEGEVKDFKPHGRGRMIFILQSNVGDGEGSNESGRNSLGNSPLTQKFSETLKSIAHDSGVQGDTYYGTWFNGLMHGNGIYHFCENDSFYEGEFEQNLLHGRGRLSVIHSSDDVPKDNNGERSKISTFEGIFEHGVPAAFGIYRSWLGSEYEGDLKLLHMEEDGSFSPSKNRAASSRETDTIGKRSRLNSLAESTKKLFMGSAGGCSDDEEGGESESELGEPASPVRSVNGMPAKEGMQTPQPSREQRFTEGSGSRERGDSVVVWEDPLAFMHAHGKGTFIYPNKDRYVGHLEDNMKHGHGKMMYANGNVYEGDFDSDLFHGKGKYTQVVKGQGHKVYTGDFQCGQRSGVGKLIFPSGACYEGQWLHDCYCGTGRYEFSNGDVYTGSFIEGKRNDVGRMQFANGNTFQGHWKDDKRIKGEFMYKNGNMYTGSFNDNVMEGIGRFEWTDGSTYEGGWLDNKAHGIGRFTKPGKSGYVYEGNWLANKKHTENGELARVIYTNGDEYVGSFLNGKMSGPGKKTFASGAPSQLGEFLDGTYQGPTATNAADF